MKNGLSKKSGKFLDSEKLSKSLSKIDFTLVEHHDDNLVDNN